VRAKLSKSLAVCFFVVAGANADTELDAVVLWVFDDNAVLLLPIVVVCELFVMTVLATEADVAAVVVSLPCLRPLNADFVIQFPVSFGRDAHVLPSSLLFVVDANVV
jgi:hypothetical protein